MQGHGQEHARGRGHAYERDERALGRGFLLIAVFAAVEAAGAWYANSIVLLADAGHMLLDASALGLAWWAIRLSRRPGTDRLTFGYGRFQVLAAFVNALALFPLAAWILVEAFGRLRAPEPVLAGPMLAIAVLGLVVNIVVFRMLHDARGLNARAAALHVLGDLLGSACALVSAGLILAFDWRLADPLLAVAVAAILARGAWRLLRESGHILVEGAPPGADAGAVRAALMAAGVPGLRDVRRVHVWAVNDRAPLAALRAEIEEGADARAATRAIEAALADGFGIDRATVQIEHGPRPGDAPEAGGDAAPQSRRQSPNDAERPRITAK